MSKFSIGISGNYFGHPDGRFEVYMEVSRNEAGEHKKIRKDANEILNLINDWVNSKRNNKDAVNKAEELKSGTSSKPPELDPQYVRPNIISADDKARIEHALDHAFKSTERIANKTTEELINLRIALLDVLKLVSPERYPGEGAAKRIKVCADYKDV